MGEWRRVPPALLLGFAIEVVFGIARVVHFSDADALRSDSWNVYDHAFTLAASGLVASGWVELSRRLPRPAAIAARVAAILVLLNLAWEVGWLVIGFYGGYDEYQVVHVLVPIVDWLPSIMIVAIAVAIGVATRRLAWLIALPVAAAIAFPIPPLEAVVMRALNPDTSTMWAVLRLGPYPLFGFACLGAAYVASLGADAPTRDRGDVAFERAAKALWLRLVAALGLAGVMVLALAARAAEAASLIRAVVVLAPAIDAFAMILFARAALGLARANVARWFVLPAAGVALWVAGVLVVRAFYTATALYGHWAEHGERMDSGTSALDRADVLPVALPLFAGAAIVLVLVAITQLLRERGREDLRESATVRTGVFVVLTLGALYITHHEAEVDYASKTRVVFALAGAAFASIYALVIAAKLCRQAATVVAGDTALPGAKLLSGGPR